MHRLKYFLYGLYRVYEVLQQSKIWNFKSYTRAFLIASFEAAFVIGNDTRAKMTEEIGLTSCFVNDATVDVLMEQYDFYKSGADSFTERFEIKTTAFAIMKALSAV